MKQAVADPTLDKAMLREVLAKNPEALAGFRVVEPRFERAPTATFFSKIPVSSFAKNGIYV